MNTHKVVLSLCCVLGLALCGCSRQQSDWQKTRETNTADAYEQFLKKYPSGEFTAQAQARVKELYEERDWQKARDADTPDAYQAFSKQYPDGKWAEEARIRIENFSLAQAPSGSPPATATAGSTAPAAGAGAAASASTSAPSSAQSAAPAARKPAPAGSAPRVAAVPQVATRAAGPHSVGPHSAGPYRVQLGAFKSGSQAAKARWAHLQHEYPHLLAGLSTKVLAKKTAEGSLYRLQAVGLTEKHAHALCTALRAKSQPCVVVPPA
jgi:cell division protein FtsN